MVYTSSKEGHHFAEVIFGQFYTHTPTSENVS